MSARASEKRKHAGANTRPLFGSRTDIGCVREHNEDSLIVAPPLYAVADGMGGHAAGEVASEIAVRTLGELAPRTADTAALASAVASCNYAVINAAQSKGRAGMGTTLTAAILEGERLALAQVGDSRAYLLHLGKMQQLTRDHSLMAEMIEAGEITEEEARTHPQRSVITRALGSDPDMLPDLYELNVSAGDRLLLCSDGLSTMISDEQICDILSRTRDPQRAATLLVNEAIAAGGTDNITVVVVDVEGNTAKQQQKTRNKSRAWAVVILFALLAVVTGICFGAYSYSQTMAYLSAHDGKVAIYTGVPETIAGLELGTLTEVTDVDVSKLQPGAANRLNSGAIRVDSLDAAYALVDEYRQAIAESDASEAALSAAQQKAGQSAKANSAQATEAAATEAKAAQQASSSASSAAATGASANSTAAGTSADGVGTDAAGTDAATAATGAADADTAAATTATAATAAAAADAAASSNGQGA